MTLRIYDVLDRAVATCVEGIRPAGRHEVRFEAGGLPGGIYFYRLEGEGFSATRMLVR